MAATKTLNHNEYFRPEKLREWPEPDSVSLMEVFAREDIDEAVNAILFRENYVVKRLDTYFQHLAIFKERRKELLHKKWVQNVAEPLQQRIIEKVISYTEDEKTKQEKFEYYLKPTNKPASAPPLCDSVFRRQEVNEEKRTSHQHRAGKQNYTKKELKETEKARPRAKSPEFKSTLNRMIRTESRRVSARPMSSGTYSPEMYVCTAKWHLPGEEETVDLSQVVFERQFHSSKLSQENRETEKKHLVKGTRVQRPHSWTAGESRHTRGPPPAGRRVMTAEVLGKHLASLQGSSRPSDF